MQIRLLKQIRIVQNAIGTIALDGCMTIDNRQIFYPTKNNVVQTVKDVLALTDLDISAVELEIVDAERILGKRQQGGDFVHSRVIVRQTFVVCDTVTGYREEYHWLGEAGDNMYKGVTVASSYAIRDFYMHFFNMTTEGMVGFEDLQALDAESVALKMNMEEIRVGLEDKAKWLMQHVGKGPMQKAAKVAGFKPTSWDLDKMDGNELWTLIRIGMEKVFPSEKGALRKTIEKIQED
jgi:hypothetical protein